MSETRKRVVFTAKNTAMVGDKPVTVPGVDTRFTTVPMPAPLAPLIAAGAAASGLHDVEITDE
jgi:hypothetical protein